MFSLHLAWIYPLCLLPLFPWLQALLKSLSVSCSWALQKSQNTFVATAGKFWWWFLTVAHGDKWMHQHVVHVAPKDDLFPVLDLLPFCPSVSTLIWSNHSWVSVLWCHPLRTKESLFILFILFMKLHRSKVHAIFRCKCYIVFIKYI